MVAISAMGPVAASMPTQVYAAESSKSRLPTTVVGTTSYSESDTMSKAKIQEMIDNSESAGTLISKSDNSFVIKIDGTTVEVSYKDADSLQLTEKSSYKTFNNEFRSREDAENFIDKMKMTDAKVTWERCATCVKYFAVGNLPMVKVSYTYSINHEKKVNSGVGTMAYECPNCGAHDYTHNKGQTENDFTCNHCGVSF